jgi:hypothetical protein
LTIPLEYLIAFAGFPVGILIVYAHRWQQRRLARRSPLTRDLLRGPGESLRVALDEVSAKVSDEGQMVLLWPILVTFTSLLAWSAKGGMTPGRLGATAALALAGAVVGGWLFQRRLRERERWRLAWDGERAVGEELNQLMRVGCHVFHDVPGENFNIDHVVAGPGGLYAVETKTRSKPARGRGVEDSRVVYDGRALLFPGWRETKPLEQAVRQAEWLSKWLTSATGELVTVQPAVALPGWWVERAVPNGITVFNPKNPVFLAKPREGAPLASKTIQRIAHQLEQRCRDVEPAAHRHAKKWPGG